MKTAQNSNVHGGHKCLSQPSQVVICIYIICIRIICICPRQAHAPVWQGMGPHEVKKSTSSFIRAKPDSHFPT